MSRAPMYVMRGELPIRTMAYYMPRGYLPIGIRMVGKYMIPSEPFKEAYFLEDALKFRKALHLPLIYVGGLVSRDKIEEVLNDEEITLPTFHPKIKIAQVRAYDYADANLRIDALVHACAVEGDMQIVKRMKEIVPEFKSQHSKYEVLDE